MHVRLVLPCSALLVIFAGWIAFLELPPAIAAGGDRDARFQALADGSFRSGLSSYSQDLLLTSCLTALTSIHGRLQEIDRRTKVSAHCREEAQVITGRTPTHSLAWFTRALIASQKGDANKMRKALVMSRATGPNEQWIAELRVDLAEDHFSLLGQENLEGNSEDLTLLVQSARGIGAIARRYVKEPEFRQRITALVEQLPEERQRAFVHEVKRRAIALGLI